MDAFQLPLSETLDFELECDGSAFLHAWDNRTSLPLTAKELKALFLLLNEYKEQIFPDVFKKEGYGGTICLDKDEGE